MRGWKHCGCDRVDHGGAWGVSMMRDGTWYGVEYIAVSAMVVCVRKRIVVGIQDNVVVVGCVMG